MQSCQYFQSATCRSCSLLALPYEEQLSLKHAELVGAFTRAGFEVSIDTVVASDTLLPSRNKAKMAVGGSTTNPAFGLVSPDYRVADITACPLHIAPIPEILAAVKPLISELGLLPYDIAARTGELKYVLVRSSETTGETLVRLVLRSRDQLREASAVLEKLQASFPQVQVISVNLQPVPQAVIEGEEEIVISPRDYIVDKIAGRDLVFSPQSFSQVTSNVAGKLCSFVAEKVRTAGVQTLLDLYCGVGAFSIISSPYVTSALGVELSEQAIRNAARSAQMNSLSNLSFEAVDVERFLAQYKDRADCSIVNPPRRGLSAHIISNLQRLKPRLLVYSSCYPDTLLRDLKLLCSSYKIAAVRPFDMFPLTSHVETAVILVPSA